MREFENGFNYSGESRPWDTGEKGGGRGKEMGGRSSRPLDKGARLSPEILWGLFPSRLLRNFVSNALFLNLLCRSECSLLLSFLFFSLKRQDEKINWLLAFYVLEWERRKAEEGNVK